MLSKSSEYRSEYEKKLREQNSEFAERQRANRREWAKANPDRLKELAAKRQTDPYMRARDKYAKYRGWLRKKYGLSVGDFLRLLQKQEGRCKLCNIELYDSKIEVDHCHKTGRVRGLLHKRCNLFLGQIEAWPEFPQLVLTYLGGTE